MFLGPDFKRAESAESADKLPLSELYFLFCVRNPSLGGLVRKLERHARAEECRSGRPYAYGEQAGWPLSPGRAEAQVLARAGCVGGCRLV